MERDLHFILFEKERNFMKLSLRIPLLALLSITCFAVFAEAQQAEKNYTTLFGYGHTYRVGDRVLANFAAGFVDEYVDATITDITPKGLVKVRYDSRSMDQVSGDYYQSAFWGLKPYSPVQSYKAGLISTHTYRVGERVLVNFAGELTAATIVVINSDGLVKVKFDSWSMNKESGDYYQEVSSLSPLSDVPQRAIAENSEKTLVPMTIEGTTEKRPAAAGSAR